MSDFVWTDLEVRRALGLRTDIGRTDIAYTGVSTDSRAVTGGELYVALVGERFDGHDFVADAQAGGARAAVVSHPVAGARDVIFYPVDDTLRALGALATHRRTALDATVVAITGSSGKTTTKDLITAAVGPHRRTHATRGNRNNRIGLPLTLLEAPLVAEVVVVEMGTSEPGEIGALTAIARPDVGVITNVGESHLEGLGSLEGVMEEKLDLLRGLPDDARCVVGDEPPELVQRARDIRKAARVAGWSDRADASARPANVTVDTLGRHAFDWHGTRVAVPLPGRHAVQDALIALTVADLLGVPPEAAAGGLAGATTGALRGQVRRIGGLTTIVDCYNANPQSVRAALDRLELHEASAPKVAVLGTMLELGEASDRLHGDVLEDALGRGFDLTVAVGAFAEAARRQGRQDDDGVVTAADWQSAYPTLRTLLRGDEVLLLKASRGIALEGMLPMLEEDFGAARDAVGGER